MKNGIVVLSVLFMSVLASDVFAWNRVCDSTLPSEPSLVVECPTDKKVDCRVFTAQRSLDPEPIDVLLEGLECISDTDFSVVCRKNDAEESNSVKFTLRNVEESGVEILEPENLVVSVVYRYKRWRATVGNSEIFDYDRAGSCHGHSGNLR